MKEREGHDGEFTDLFLRFTDTEVIEGALHTARNILQLTSRDRSEDPWQIRVHLAHNDAVEGERIITLEKLREQFRKQDLDIVLISSPDGMMHQVHLVIGKLLQKRHKKNR